MPNGERRIARKIEEKIFGKKTEGKKEAITSQEKEEIAKVLKLQDKEGEKEKKVEK
ncbi:hypothetical protein KJ636_01280 [Patescibacteria group bacterium]|nr:hypothetical protein [Patescibacteria group bacterium]MBU4481749.1 hypothetical protein [Patescibacteria group bacterium]